MAVSQKLQETGWFYHAPPKRSNNAAPVPVPPASQIPGLSDLPPDTEEHHTVLIKDFDSPYVRMAKMGGRPDLLRMHTPKPVSANAKPYPKVDWFYQEDIKMEEDERREKQMDDVLPEKPHEFLLPDYMVHPDNEAGQPPPQQSKRGKHTQTQKWKPAPFAMDYDMPFQNEGHSGQNRVKHQNGAPDEKKVGYGVRKPKPNKHMPSSYNMPPREQLIKPVGELGEHHNNVPPMSATNEDGHISMAKLMEHGYGRDWEDDRNRWYEKQQKVSDRFDDVTQQRQDEVERHMLLEQQQQQQQAAANTNQNARLKKDSVQQEPKKELFKLSRFKKVPAKTDTHRRRSGPKLPDVTQNSSTSKNVAPSKENMSSNKQTTNTHKAAAAARDLEGPINRMVISPQNGDGLALARSKHNPVEPEILKLDHP